MEIQKFGVLTEKKNIQFKGRREFKNVVSQLSKNNSYSLTDPNQRYITKAITELGKVKGSKNIKFLLDTAAKNAYSTNIVLKDAPKHNWKDLLLGAAAAAIAITPFISKNIKKQVAEMSKPQELLPIEKDILELRKQMLSQVNLEQIKKETQGTVKDFEKNLDYLIISSETTLEHKKYILERLNYFMSDEYEINPQLKDKKSIAVAEMVNDMAIAVPGNKIPNIKAVNQRQHGICAAISIVRKKLAYEDKPNYVDSIISELDSSGTISVYDRNELGSGKKILLEKVPVDFETALSKGYRIIDTSTMHWMQLAHMTGSSFIPFKFYHPFDKGNFDVKTDSFLNIQVDDDKLKKEQEYYQSLIYAKSVLEKYKAARIKKDVVSQESKAQKDANIKALADIRENITLLLKEIAPETTDIKSLMDKIFKLKCPSSSKIKENDIYSYIPNEEDIVKKEKIKNFIINETKVNSIEDSKIDDLFDAIEFHNATLYKINVANQKTSKISRANKLYNVAASFRYQILKGLENSDILKDVMVNEGIKDRETLLVNHIDNLIDKLENNSPHSGLIISQISKNLEGVSPDKESVLDGLYNVKDILNQLLTVYMDDLYKSLTYGNRVDGLVIQIDNIIERIENGDTKLVETFSGMLGYKKSSKSVIQALENVKEQLIKDPSSYNEIFSKLKNTSQIDHIRNIYNNFIEEVSQEDNDEVVAAFLEANNLRIEDDPEAFTKELDIIQKNITTIDDFVKLCNSNLKVYDENGDVFYSADPKDVIIKKLENDKRIISSTVLRELQEHFTKITKAKATDEFDSRQGKIKDKTLLEFSNREKEALSDTEKSINPMLQYVEKQITYMEKELKDLLEELKRLISVNTGEYWVPKEGSSGLFDGESIRILEFMTGRPHYLESDLKKGIDTIKKGQYSGISVSSVYHNERGYHDQYVADIATVKLKNGEEKEVLFHDNTWGACEDENTWTDSNGLLRTDYSDNRGGTLGYITNKDYRNGNFVDRIVNDMHLFVEPEKVNSKQYKNLKPDMSMETPISQYSGFVLDGKKSVAEETSSRLHDALFIPGNLNIKRIDKKMKNLSYQELKDKINSMKLSNKTWKSVYENLKNRLFPINKSEEITEEIYKKLPDDDYLKVVIEKVALKENGQIVGQEVDLARVKNVQDLEKFRVGQKIRAINSFKYAFAKDFSINDYMVDLFAEEQYEEIDKILDKYNIKLSDEEFNVITGELKFDSKDFDGSLRKTINVFTKTFTSNVNKVVKNADAQAEIKNYIESYLKDKLYFNLSDLDMYQLENQEHEHIVKFIDKIYDPESDEEFVKIYNKIQNMTSEEFKKEVLSKVDNEALGLKNLTGIDVLRAIKNYNEEMNTALLNTVWYDSKIQENESEKNKSYYKYSKLLRKPRIIPNRDFNYLYTEMKNDLEILNLESIFNKYKANNHRKYGAYPAYPKLDYMNDKFLHTSFDPIFNAIRDNVSIHNAISDQLINYNLSEDLEEILKNTPSSKAIVGDEYAKLTEIFGKLVTLNVEDQSMQDVYNFANDALELDEGTLFKEFIPYINSVIKIMNTFKATAPAELIEKSLREKEAENFGNKKTCTEIFIQSKYQNRFKELINKYEQALINSNFEEAEKLEEECYEFFKKYHILRNPEDVLDTYILSKPIDSPFHRYHETYAKLLTRCFQFATALEVQDILMQAIFDSVALETKNSFKTQGLLKFATGEYSMDSNEMIAYMTNLLILDDSYETAIMFLEKLGLKERYVEHYTSRMDFNAIEKNLRSVYETLDNFEKFKTNIDPYLDAFSTKGLDKKAIFKSIENLKKEIKEQGEIFNVDKEVIKILIRGLNGVKNNYKDYVNSSNQSMHNSIIKEAKRLANEHVQLIYNSIIQEVKSLANEKVQSIIDQKKQELDAQTTIYNLICQLKLRNESEAYNAREQMVQKFANIIALEKQLNENRNSAVDLQEN